MSGVAAVLLVISGPAIMSGVHDVFAVETVRALGAKWIPSVIEICGRMIIFERFAVLAAILLVWGKAEAISLSSLNLTSEEPITLGESLAVAVLVLVICRLIFTPMSRKVARKFPPHPHPLSKGSLTFWILALLTGSTVEETWRALSLQALQRVNLGAAAAVLITSLAFVYANLSGIPSRIPGRPWTEVVWQLILGCFFGVLFLEFGTVLVPLGTSVIFNIINLLLIRHSTDNPSHALT